MDKTSDWDPDCLFSVYVVDGMFRVSARPAVESSSPSEGSSTRGDTFAEEGYSYKVGLSTEPDLENL